jgi:hypothetical protein
MLHLARWIVQKLAAQSLPAPQTYAPPSEPDKYDAEANFWRLEIAQYVAWYNNEVTLYGVVPPYFRSKGNGVWPAVRCH